MVNRLSKYGEISKDILNRIRKILASQVGVMIQKVSNEGVLVSEHDLLVSQKGSGHFTPSFR